MNNFLFVVEGVGIVFVAVFLAAYLGGLPTTAVLHIEPAFRTTLAVVGVVFLIFILAAVVLAALQKRITV